MLRERVSTASAEIIETELITTGRRGLECAFEFNSAWDGLAKTVIVNGVVKRDIVLVSDTIVVPGECLAREQFPLRIGVYGANGAGEIVIPTIWANFGKILPSARPSGVDPDEVTPDVVAQIQQNSSDALRMAQEVMRRADSGEFDGRDGATGPAGRDGSQGPTGASGVYVGTTAPTDPSIKVWVDTNGDPDPEIAAVTATVDDAVGTPSVDVTLSGPANSRIIALAFHNLKGNTGPSGPQGIQGEAGPAGVGVPTGGTAGQVLAKASGADFDTEWVDQSGGTQEVFWAEYNTTSFSDIESAANAGKAVMLKLPSQLNGVIIPLSVISTDQNQTKHAEFYGVSGSGDSYVYTAICDAGTNFWSMGRGHISAAAPVQSVNGQTGAVSLSIPSKTSDLTNDSGFLTQHQDISGKLDKAQGVAHAGEFCVVGSDGNITTVSMTAWQGGSY